MDYQRRAELRLACLQQAVALVHQHADGVERVEALARRFAAFVLDEPNPAASPPAA